MKLGGLEGNAEYIEEDSKLCDVPLVKASRGIRLRDMYESTTGGWWGSGLTKVSGDVPQSKDYATRTM